jgi:hypothetical protein
MVCAANQLEVEMQRRELETAAARFTYLRGLLLIPLGLLFVVAALGNWKVGPFRHDWVFIAAVLAIGAVYLVILRYYNEHYGRLNPSSAQQARAVAAVAVCVAVMIGLSLLLRSRAEWSLDLPVNAIAVAFALVMLVSYAITVGLHAHHVVIWGTVLVAGALPVWDGADPSNVGLVIDGVAVMVCGVFDHRLFVRAFGTPPLPALENGSAHA